jgi:V8-like Glu-specific endopeptidase
VAQSVPSQIAKDVVLIEVKNPANPESITYASGVIIGPHSILTAAHVLWNGIAGKEAKQVYLYPGYNAAGYPEPDSQNSVPGLKAWYNYYLPQMRDAHGTPTFVTSSESANDFGIIDVAATFSSWVPVAALNSDFSSRDIFVSGYPASEPGVQATNFGSVQQDNTAGILDYTGMGSIDSGYSGGPVWQNREQWRHLSRRRRIDAYQRHDAHIR